MTTDLPVRRMRRLRESHQIWLVKERIYGYVTFPYHPAAPGHRCGRLTFKKIHDNRVAPYHEVWYVGEHGEGLDGNQLIWPCRGHLDPEDAVVLAEAEERLRVIINRMQTHIDVLADRVTALEWRLMTYGIPTF